MKQISTGAGLCVLGGCVLAATLTQSMFDGTTAHAADGTGERLNASFDAASRGASTPQRHTPRVSTMSPADCSIRVEHWFSPIPHRIGDCSRFTYHIFLSIYMPCDMLGDGKSKLVTSNSWGQFNSGDSYLEIVEFSPLPDGTTQKTFVQILSAEDGDLLANLGALGVSLNEIQIAGFCDIDSDGDLDLVLYSSSNWYAGHIWLENIRGDVSRASPFDLDHDGGVNTADLSLLLLNFD